MRDLARAFPVSVVADLIGIPGSVRDEVAVWADASCAPLLSAYTTAGIDTTVNALSNAVLCFAREPEQWDAVRRGGPEGINDAFNEVLRYDSPVQAFTRVVTAEVEVGHVRIREGERIVVLYGSGNRDDRHYSDPDRFDVSRRPGDHLSFGYGVHACAGQGLARMEAEALLSALAARVKRFRIGTPVRHLNNVVRGLESLPVEGVEVG
ncbi:cytochrome P450 [Streptomyces javensis]|uniref:Cytochrome P450 n=1 Tax=Streptomyces javensis TaxID=114698 RepID=A0ABN1X6F9_9ACTN